MYRDIFTNKWVLSGIGFLIMLTVACVLWYQHDTAPYRQAASEAEELLRQSEVAKKVDVTDSETEQATDAPVESNTPTAEKLVNENPAEVKNNTEAEIQVQQNETPSENAAESEVRVSPFGFGPYPEVPEDYPSVVVWLQSDYEELPSHAQKNFELMSRVLIKLWASGEKGFRGASTYNGKIYPHYYDTVYIKVREYELPDGTKAQYISRRKSGPHVNTAGVDLLNPPSHLRVLDLESSGIDPYQYLNLR